MKKFIFIQTPILDKPEYDVLVERHVPEIHDLITWPKHLQLLVLKYLQVEPDILIEHLIKCSTPPTAAGLRPEFEIQQAINRLHASFGTTYIV
jgi:hypothetical protein